MGVPTSEVGYTSATARKGGPRKFVWTCGGIREREKKGEKKIRGYFFFYCLITRVFAIFQNTLLLRIFEPNTIWRKLLFVLLNVNQCHSMVCVWVRSPNGKDFWTQPKRWYVSCEFCDLSRSDFCVCLIARPGTTTNVVGLNVIKNPRWWWAHGPWGILYHCKENKNS